MSNKNFYKELDSIEEFSNIFKDSNYKAVPSNWYVIATDVVDSTTLIENGKYKEINLVAAMSIISILNINKEIDIPYIFGGDGSFLLIPNDILQKSKQALIKIKKMAKESYSLDLRVGIIPVREIYKKNKEILISKYKISKDCTQAMVKGGGLSYADFLLKRDEAYFVKDKEDKSFELDISGLECRWESVKSPKDENITILLEAYDESNYKKILDDLESILGSNSLRSPVIKDNLKLSFKNSDLEKEAAIMSKSKIGRFFILQKLKLINLLGKFLMENKVSNWAFYKDRIVSTTDNEKFDDMLRMVVAVTKQQSKKLEEYLSKQREEKKIVYGIHKSDSSLMTCLIFERHGKHVHFIDGSNGGYALAAKELKKLK